MQSISQNLNTQRKEADGFQQKTKHQKVSVIYHSSLQKPIMARWGLLADRHGLPIRDYWQTVDKICTRLPKSYCWQTPGALYKRETITALFKRLRQRASACHLQPVTFPQVPGG